MLRSRIPTLRVSHPVGSIATSRFVRPYHPQGKPGAIVIGEPKGSKKEYEELAKEYDVTFLGAVDRPTAISKIAEIAKSDKNKTAVLFCFGSSTGPTNEELLGPLKGQLKFVSGIGAGYDTVDVDWLASIGSWYANTPEAVSDTTATTAVLLILQSLRHSSSMEHVVRQGKWREGAVYTHDHRGFVVGIHGMGTIGKLVRDKVQALGMKVIYSNRKRLPAEEEKGATYVTFDELLTQSQLISIHIPLSAKTRHTFSTKEFEKMRDGVMIVNTARGAVIDEKALVEALKSGKVARAGLDVFEYEPKIEPYLLETYNTSLLPHFASSTVRLPIDTELEVISNFREWAETGKPTKGVNSPVGVSKAGL